MSVRSQTALAALLLCAIAIGRGGEPLSVAGFVVRLPNGISTAPYALQDSRNQQNVAALSDPRGVLREADWAFLQVETTDTFAQGLPVLEVVDVLPEYWEQPAIWNPYAKGFGAWSGFGNEFRGKNYAGPPMEDRRAYLFDNGLENFFSGTGNTGGSHPPVLLHAQLVPQGLLLTWNVQSGSRYDVLGSADLTGGYALVGNVVAPNAGSASLTVPTGGTQKFFKIRY